MTNDAEAQRLWDRLEQELVTTSGLVQEAVEQGFDFTKGLDHLEQALVTTERLVREAVERGYDFDKGLAGGLWPTAECLHEHKENHDMLVNGVNGIFQLIMGACPECGGSWLVAFEGTGAWE